MGGEEKKLSFEEFPFTASSKTYCVNKQVADSACTSTAYLHGKKATGSTVGLNAKATHRNCFDTMDPEKRSDSIGKWAQDAGKSAGLVTTTRVTHASPAGLYAGSASRYWEDDYNIRSDKCDPDLIDDITEQLVHGEVGKKLKVIFGGGSREFINDTKRLHNARGYRTDGKNLLEDWKLMSETRTYVDDRESLLNLDPTKVNQVLGLFHASHCPYNLNVIRDNQQEIYPSLLEMTEKAIDIMSQNEEGYFLFVEGGRIDHGHHETRAKYAIDETVEFAKAIEAAVKKVNTSETLIVVSADHSHAMTIAGYAVSLSPLCARSKLIKSVL
jgi:alkaline phosphatase